MIRPVPEKQIQDLKEVYNRIQDLVLRATITTLDGGHFNEPVVVRVDAIPATETLRGLYDVFTYGLPDQVVQEIDSIFSQLTKWADTNVARSVPGIPTNFFFPQAAVKEIRREQVSLIKKASRRQVKETLDLLERNNGLHSSDLRKLVQERIGKDKKRAELWARDQTLKFNARVTKERHTALGITEYIWTTSQDERVRERHQDFSNKTYKYSEPPLSDSGERINPGEDYQCRCTAFPRTASSAILNQGVDTDRIAARQARAEKLLKRKKR